MALARSQFLITHLRGLDVILALDGYHDIRTIGNIIHYTLNTSDTTCKTFGGFFHFRC